MHADLNGNKNRIAIKEEQILQGMARDVYAEKELSEEDLSLEEKSKEYMKSYDSSLGNRSGDISSLGNDSSLAAENAHNN